MRPSWDDYFMSIAFLVSTRATCDRKKVGAVLVKDRTIISTGYNGAASGMPHCDQVGHELKEIEGRPSCVRTIHAESNAIDQARESLEGAVLYTNVIPCYDCAKRIVNAKVSKVMYAEYYASRNTELVEAYFYSSQGNAKDRNYLHGNGTELIKWNGEFITPAIPDEIIQRTINIQKNRAL